MYGKVPKGWWDHMRFEQAQSFLGNPVSDNHPLVID